MKTLMTEIKPNARTILAELAKKPEGYLRKDLVQTPGIEEQAIRGQMSSLGAARRRMGGKPSPILSTKIDGEFAYKLDPAFAAIFKQQLGSEQL